MKFSTSISIDAPAMKVWQILTNAEAYPDWDPGMIRLEGEIAPGNKITAYTKISPDRAFPVTVTEFDPGRKMVWASKMPLGLFRGERSFVITEKEAGIDFYLEEEFGGILLPLIGRTIPDLQPSFEDFAKGLKARAEA